MDTKQTAHRLASRFLRKIAYKYSDPAEYAIAMRAKVIQLIQGNTFAQDEDVKKALFGLKKILDKKLRQDQFGNLVFSVRLNGKSFEGKIHWDQGITWLKMNDGMVYHEPEDAVQDIFSQLSVSRKRAPASPGLLIRRQRMASWRPNNRNLSPKMVKFLMGLHQEMDDWDSDASYVVVDLARLVGDLPVDRQDFKSIRDLLPDVMDEQTWHPENRGMVWEMAWHMRSKVGLQ